MPWNDADYYLLAKLKKLESQMDYVISKLGSQGIIVVSGGGGVLSGIDDPNVAGIVPAPSTQPAIYQQYEVDGVTPKVVWWWHVGSQTWL